MITISLHTTPKFPLGHVVITANATARLDPDRRQRSACAATPPAIGAMSARRTPAKTSFR